MTAPRMGICSISLPEEASLQSPAWNVWGSCLDTFRSSGSDGGEATARQPQMLIRRLSRRRASSFLRDGQGFGFMALVCTKDLRLLSSDMQLKHAS